MTNYGCRQDFPVEMEHRCGASTYVLFLGVQWPASPANIYLLVFMPGKETGTAFCTRMAENVLLSALPSAPQTIVKQTVKLHGA